MKDQVSQSRIHSNSEIKDEIGGFGEKEPNAKILVARSTFVNLKEAVIGQSLLYIPSYIFQPLILHYLIHFSGAVFDI